MGSLSIASPVKKWKNNEKSWHQIEGLTSLYNCGKLLCETNPFSIKICLLLCLRPLTQTAEDFSQNLLSYAKLDQLSLWSLSPLVNSNFLVFWVFFYEFVAFISELTTHSSMGSKQSTNSKRKQGITNGKILLHEVTA